MAENKVVIRIKNYDRDKGKSERAPARPQTVTVWHLGRIFTVLAVLGLSFAVVIAVLRENGSPVGAETAKHGDAAAPPVANSEGISAVVSQSVAAKQTEELAKPALKSRISESREISGFKELKRLPAIIFDRRVIRASLNSMLKDNEPFVQVKSPIKLAKNQTIELFYFTEFKNIKDKVLYHYWSKEGVVVYKKRLEIKGNKIKVSNYAKLIIKSVPTPFMRLRTSWANSSLDHVTKRRQ